ncbi:MAG: TetR/AcrR family transcriptional regulator [Steroidobacteraceae bacterium]
MSGKPQYDEAAVIDAAIGVFWRLGFAATSISELTDATGISRSSLYQRFGDKDGLFREALTRYTERVLRRMDGVRADTARARVEALLREFVTRDGKSKRPPGCLLARSCSEMANLSEAGQLAAKVGLKQQKAILDCILRDASERSELARGADVEGLAWYYVGIIQAVLNLPQAGASRLELERMIDIAMLAWPTPIVKGR